MVSGAVDFGALEFYGLRPNVLLSLYVERGLWNRLLARAATP